MPDCPRCGARVPDGSRFCLECGRALAPAGEPRPGRLGLPAAVRVPAPATLVAVLIAVGGIILLVGGVWAWGIVALLVAALVAVLATRVDRYTVADARRRAEALRESVAVRGRGQVELFRARRDLAELEAERGRLFHELGRAVYEDDAAGTETARAALDGAAEAIRRKESDIETLIRETEERVRRVQTPVQPTERLSDEAPPEPPRIPEPWPPPDEGDIPEPPAPDPAPPGAPPPDPTPEPPGPSGDRER